MPHGSATGTAASADQRCCRSACWPRPGWSSEPTGCPSSACGGVRTADDVRQYLRVGRLAGGDRDGGAGRPAPAGANRARAGANRWLRSILALDLPSRHRGAAPAGAHLPGRRWVKVGSDPDDPGRRPVCVRALVDPWPPRSSSTSSGTTSPTRSRGRSRAARELGVAMATVHTLGGAGDDGGSDRSLRRAVLALVGVTVLTSHDAASLRRRRGPATASSLADEVARLADEARRRPGSRAWSARPRRSRSCVGSLPDGARIVVPGIRRGVRRPRATRSGSPPPPRRPRREPPISSSVVRSSRRRTRPRLWPELSAEAQCVRS